MNEKPRVLFLCTHNAARSQMAEALLRWHGGTRFEAASAGLQPTEVHRLRRQVLDEIGADKSPSATNLRRPCAGREVLYLTWRTPNPARVSL